MFVWQFGKYFHYMIATSATVELSLAIAGISWLYNILIPMICPAFYPFWPVSVFCGYLSAETATAVIPMHFAIVAQLVEGVLMSRLYLWNNDCVGCAAVHASLFAFAFCGFCGKCHSPFAIAVRLGPFLFATACTYQFVCAVSVVHVFLEDMLSLHYCYTACDFTLVVADYAIVHVALAGLAVVEFHKGFQGWSLGACVFLTIANSIVFYDFIVFQINKSLIPLIGQVLAASLYPECGIVILSFWVV